MIICCISWSFLREQSIVLIVTLTLSVWMSIHWRLYASIEFNLPMKVMASSKYCFKFCWPLSVAGSRMHVMLVWSSKWSGICAVTFSTWFIPCLSRTVCDAASLSLPVECTQQIDTLRHVTAFNDSTNYNVVRCALTMQYANHTAHTEQWRKPPDRVNKKRNYQQWLTRVKHQFVKHTCFFFKKII